MQLPQFPHRGIGLATTIAQILEDLDFSPQFPHRGIGLATRRWTSCWRMASTPQFPLSGIGLATPMGPTSGPARRSTLNSRLAGYSGNTKTALVTLNSRTRDMPHIPSIRNSRISGYSRARWSIVRPYRLEHLPARIPPSIPAQRDRSCDAIHADNCIRGSPPSIPARRDRSCDTAQERRRRTGLAPSIPARRDRSCDATPATCRCPHALSLNSRSAG